MKPLIFLLYVVSFALSASAGPNQLSFQGRLFDDSGDPLTSGTVNLTVQVRSNDSSCLLYEEAHSLGMSDSSGFFSLNIGSGTQNTTSAPNFSLVEAFGNATNLSHAQMDCTGNSYTPAATHGRTVRVFVNGTALEPDQKISASPFAIYANDANALQGKSYSDITTYADSRLAGQTVPATATLGAGQALRWSGTAWEAFTPAGGGLGAGSGLTVNGGNLDVQAGTNITVNGTGVHVTQGAGSSLDADLLDGQQGAYYLDWGNLTNAVTLTAGSGLTGGGALSSNRTVAHADTSSQASVDNSNGSVIQDVTLDGFGHVTALTSVDLDSRYLAVTTGAVNSTHLADNSVDSAEIAANAVTNVKMADNAIGNAEMADNAIGNAEMADNAIGSAEVIANSLTDADLAPNSVTDSEIAANAVTNVKMADNAIGNAEMADNAIGNAEMADNAIGSAEVIANSLTDADLAPNSVTDSEIAANAVNSSEIAQLTGNIGMNDNILLNFGTGNDFNISHNGTHSYLSSVLHGAQIHIQGEDAGGTNRTMAYFDPDNNAYLHYNGTWKARTLSDGFEVVGNMKATAFLYTSDRRLKTKIEDIKGLEHILKMRGVTFDWKEDGRPEVGLIAQEVEAILPDLVYTDPVTGMKAVKYGNLVAPLIESVKELHQTNLELQDQITELKAKNDELARRLERLEKAVLGQ